MPDSTVHKTNIFGQEYIMKSSADAELMSEISNYVNQKMVSLVMIPTPRVMRQT